jgi:signal transduction histidine kinase
MSPNFVNGESAKPSSPIDEFLYILGHDIRSSVRALVEIPKWIEEDLFEVDVKVSQDVVENLSLLNTHTARLDQMLTDLLTYSKVVEGKPRSILSLQKCLELMLQRLSVPDGFEIHTNLKIDSIVFHKGDFILLLTSIFSNSIKHHSGPRGQIDFVSWLDGDYLKFSIQDDGPGVDAQFRDRIFEPMKTLKPRDEVEGSGMGLSTVKRITQVNGGNLRWIPSRHPQGFGLEFSFPLSMAKTTEL